MNYMFILAKRDVYAQLFIEDAGEWYILFIAFRKLCIKFRFAQTSIQSNF